jgi:hypothetical protein
MVFQAPEAKRGLPALFKAAFLRQKPGVCDPSQILRRGGRNPLTSSGQGSGACQRDSSHKDGPVNVCPDPQALDWLRSKGEGRLARINDILTNRMEAESRTCSGNEMMLVVLMPVRSVQCS